MNYNIPMYYLPVKNNSKTANITDLLQSLGYRLQKCHWSSPGSRWKSNTLFINLIILVAEYFIVKSCVDVQTVPSSRWLSFFLRRKRFFLLRSKPAHAEWTCLFDTTGSWSHLPFWIYNVLYVLTLRSSEDDWDALFILLYPSQKWWMNYFLRLPNEARLVDWCGVITLVVRLLPSRSHHVPTQLRPSTTHSAYAKRVLKNFVGS